MLFGAFGASLYVSYLYYKEHQPQPIPAEVKDNMSQIIITLNYPIENENVSGEITISGTVECSDTINSVQVKIDRGELLEVNGKENWQLDYDTNSIENGIHHIYVYVTCSNGDYSVESFSFIVDNENNANNGVSTPGFEVLSLILSVIIAFLFIRRIK